MKHRRLKEFWINKINDLRTTHGVEPDAADWEDQINKVEKWRDFKTLGETICRNIYTKAGQPVPSPITTNAENYGVILSDAFVDLETSYNELVEVFEEKIGLDPSDDTLVTKTRDDGTTYDILEWKDTLVQKIPTYANSPKIVDIPTGIDFVDLLYRHDLYLELTNDANGVPFILEENLTNPNKVNAYGWNFDYKVDQDNLTSYQVLAETNNLNQLFNLLGINAADPFPANWAFQLAKKTDLDTANASVANLTPKANDYDRIHDKLNGKVSDSDLEALKNNSPSCSHTDYDTIKDKLSQVEQEHQNCQAEKTQASTQASQQKEREIINKIITDLQLSTERENVLEAVITEIKAKITPPTDSGKDTKIRELETQITSLKEPKTLKDLPISNGIKEEVVKMSKELGLSTQTFTKLENATSYQQLSTIQKEAFQEKLSDEVSRRKNSHYLNYILGTLTIGSLIALAFVLWKMTKKDIETNFPKKDKE